MYGPSEQRSMTPTFCSVKRSEFDVKLEPFFASAWSLETTVRLYFCTLIVGLSHLNVKKICDNFEDSITFIRRQIC